MKKARSQRSLRRAKPTRDPYEKILVVCEGEKTEPNYFGEMRDLLRLSSANIVVTGECGSSPKSVVDHAKELYRREQRLGDPYDCVFCVFDRDGHHTYQQACQIIANWRPSGKFFAITSVPCFEYWILLHFVYKTRPYNAVGAKSAAGHLIDELLDHWPDYRKGVSGLYSHLEKLIDTACTNATRALSDAQAIGTDNPTTKVHLLVRKLQQLKK